MQLVTVFVIFTAALSPEFRGFGKRFRRSRWDDKLDGGFYQRVAISYDMKMRLRTAC